MKKLILFITLFLVGTTFAQYKGFGRINYFNPLGSDSIGLISGISKLNLGSSSRFYFGNLWQTGSANNYFAGNVGIGITGPGYKLDVNGDMNLAAGNVYRIGGVVQSGSSKWTAGIGNNIYKSLGNVGIGTTGPQNKLDVAGGLTVTGAISTGKGLGLSDEGSYKRIQSWESEPLSINPLGNNVGIGTTAPSERLHVAGSGATKLIVQDTVGGGFARLVAAGTDAYVGSNHASGKLFFQSGSAFNRAVIDENGNIGIGTTTFLRTEKLRINGMTLIGDTLWVGNNTIYSYIKPGDLNWTVSSDINKKQNIKDITGINLSNFSKVLPKTYNFKKQNFIEQADNLDDATKKSERQYIGFLAEDFNQKLFGNSSTEIDYNKVIVVMWLKIQELEERIKRLESK